jgi:hypothetical protein
MVDRVAPMHVALQRVLAARTAACFGRATDLGAAKRVTFRNLKKKATVLILKIDF